MPDMSVEEMKCDQYEPHIAKMQKILLLACLVTSLEHQNSHKSAFFKAMRQMKQIFEPDFVLLVKRMKC